jgi:hypothetical protein
MLVVGAEETSPMFVSHVKLRPSKFLFSVRFMLYVSQKRTLTSSSPSMMYWVPS